MSQYEQYPLSFFDAQRRSTWAIEPTGNYRVDCETDPMTERPAGRHC
jgi:hypothetical protein